MSTHAHSQAGSTRAVSHTPALTLYTHPGARTFLHIRLRTDSLEHTLSHTHPLSHTQPLFFAPSHTHTVNLTTPTHALKHLHASLTRMHTYTHILLLIFALFTHLPTLAFASTLPVSHCHVRSHSHAHAHFPRACAHRFTLNPPIGAHTLAHAHLSRRGRSAERGCQVSALGPRLVAVFSACGFSMIP